MGLPSSRFDQEMGRATDGIAMKLSLCIFLVLVAVAGAAAGASKEREGKETVEGYLVDLACVNQRSAELATLGPKHTRRCLTMPQCERSGYAVLSHDLKVFKFDAAGTKRQRSSLRPRNARTVIGSRQRARSAASKCMSLS